MDVNGFTELKLLLSANLGQMKQQMYTEVTKGNQQLTLNKSYRRALFMWLSEAVRH